MDKPDTPSYPVYHDYYVTTVTSHTLTVASTLTTLLHSTSTDKTLTPGPSMTFSCPPGAALSLSNVAKGHVTLTISGVDCSISTTLVQGYPFYSVAVSGSATLTASGGELSSGSDIRTNSEWTLLLPTPNSYVAFPSPSLPSTITKQMAQPPPTGGYFSTTSDRAIDHTLTYRPGQLEACCLNFDTGLILSDLVSGVKVKVCEERSDELRRRFYGIL